MTFTLTITFLSVKNMTQTNRNISGDTRQNRKWVF